MIISNVLALTCQLKRGLSGLFILVAVWQPVGSFADDGMLDPDWMDRRLESAVRLEYATVQIAVSKLAGDLWRIPSHPLLLLEGGYGFMQDQITVRSDKQELDLRHYGNPNIPVYDFDMQGKTYREALDDLCEKCQMTWSYSARWNIVHLIETPLLPDEPLYDQADKTMNLEAVQDWLVQSFGLSRGTHRVASDPPMSPLYNDAAFQKLRHRQVWAPVSDGPASSRDLLYALVQFQNSELQKWAAEHQAPPEGAWWVIYARGSGWSLWKYRILDENQMISASKSVKEEREYLAAKYGALQPTKNSPNVFVPLDEDYISTAPPQLSKQGAMEITRHGDTWTYRMVEPNTQRIEDSPSK